MRDEIWEILNLSPPFPSKRLELVFQWIYQHHRLRPLEASSGTIFLKYINEKLFVYVSMTKAPPSGILKIFLFQF